MTKHEFFTYRFDELTEEQKEKVLEKNHDINVDDSWWSNDVIDDIKSNIAPLLGMDIDNIYFSGFWTQGDGAMFEGSYLYRKGMLREVKKAFPRDSDLHKIAKKLVDFHRRNGYKLYVKTRQVGRYYHSYSMEIGFCDVPETFTQSTKDEFAEILRDFADYIYDRLETEFEYLTSKESIILTIESNEYEFTENGDIK